MLNEGSGHLSLDQISCWLEEEALGTPASGRAADRKGAEEHLSRCESCARLLEAQRGVAADLRRLEAVVRTERSAGCPAEAKWPEMAAGLLNADEIHPLLRHAAECDYCGSLLRAAQQDLAPELSEDERTTIAALRSSDPIYQSALARQMATRSKTGIIRRNAKSRTHTERPSGARFPIFPLRINIKGWAIAASLALIALGGWLGFLVFSSTTPDKLIARAYSERRTMELRIPGAAYAPLAVERGNAGSSLDKPASLLKAESLIAEHLQRDPGNPVWLQEKARADLLDGNYDSAINSLRHAREADPEAPSLLTDLGTAYYERASSDSQNFAADFGKAYELFSMALAKTPNDTVALFNRAIVAEKIAMLTQAEEDWKRYLEIDSNGPWSGEARSRLQRLQNKYHSWLRKRSEPISPAQLIQPDRSSAAWDNVDQRIEEYLHIAVREWLPRAFPVNVLVKPDPNDRLALSVLGQICLERHHDHWLWDLLTQPQGPEFGRAVEALSGALAANDRGDYDKASDLSNRSEVLFIESSNSAGIAQARFEHLFALQFIRNGTDCAEKATESMLALQSSSYAWLRAQVLLEDAVCKQTNKDTGGSRSQVELALKTAQESRYVETYLRGITFSADSAANAGDLRSDWRQVLQALKIYWDGSYSNLRGYSLYDPVISAAEAAKQPHLQVAAWKQAIAFIDSDADLLQRGMAHFYLAQAAMDAELLPLFDDEYREYSRLFALAPHGTGKKNDKVEIEFVTAELEARRGNVEQARSRLAELLPTVDGSDDAYRLAEIYGALGQLELRAGDLAAAERHLGSGVGVARRELGSLRSGVEVAQWRQETGPLYRALVEQKLLTSSATDALEVWEGYLASTIRDSSVDLNTVQSHYAQNDGLLNPGSDMVRAVLPRIVDRTILSYVLLQDGLLIWAYDNRGISHVFIKSEPKQIESMATHFRDVCADSSSNVDVARRSGRELYQVLIAPIESHLDPNRALVVEADGVITLVPFEALVDKSDHYLAERHNIILSLGLYNDLLLRPARFVRASDPALVVGVSAPRGFPALPDVSDEVDAVAGHFTAPRLLKDDKATLSAVLDSLPSTAVFYFAGHAVARPGRVGLLMGNVDSRTGSAALLTSDMLSRKLLEHTQLVILAACDTADGEDGTYMDISSLAGALVRAGVPQAVASRWRLSSGAADYFIVADRLPGEDINTKTHPFYWASLSHFGGFYGTPLSR